MHHPGQILYERNSNEKLYPASLTKVLTAIVVMENANLDAKATVSQTALNSVEDGYVTSNLKVGEELTIEELLNILIVSSANDVAVVLAENISGSVDNFCTLMNQTAAKIGCTNSNFVNQPQVFLCTLFFVRDKIILRITNALKKTLSPRKDYHLLLIF